MLNLFIKSCTILGSLLALAGSQVSAQDKKPNIVFFITDDYGWQDTSEAMWTEQTRLNKIFRTPNMERLADQGVKFTNAWDRLCGVHCKTHGRKAPIEVEFINKTHPVSKAINLDRFKTSEGELYRTKLNEGTVAIAKGTTLAGNKSDHTQICVFAHELDGIRVFGTTLGHHNSTMEMPEYKKMIINAILWTSGKIDNGGFSK